MRGCFRDLKCKAEEILEDGGVSIFLSRNIWELAQDSAGVQKWFKGVSREISGRPKVPITYKGP